MKKQVALLLSVCATFSIFSACSEEHTHNYGTEWLKNETHHWQVCKDEDCSKLSEKTEHSWENDACTVCGQVKENGIRTTITEEEWEQAFIMDNYSIHMTRQTTTMFEALTVLMTENACYLKDLLDNEGLTVWQLKKGDEILTFSKTENDELFTAFPFPKTIIGTPPLIMTFSNPSFTFNDATYDGSKQAYIYESKDNNEYTEIYFEDGKLKEMKILEVIDGVTQSTKLLTITNRGTTVLTPPDYLLQ